MDELTMRVRVAERKFLRWGWWVFPAAGVAVAMLTGGGFWAWVDGETPWLDWRQAFTARGAVLAGVGLAAVGVWWALLRRRWPGWAVALMVLAGFGGVECAVRIPAVQTTFWLVANYRIPAQANTGFLRDVCRVRLETAAMRQEPKPAIVVVGSSQVVEGVDACLLAKFVPACVVVKRAVSAMRPLEALASQRYIPIRKGDVVVQYLSEFDFTNKDAFPFAWFRPFASWEGWIGVSHAIGLKRVFQDWRGGLDFALAASLETWRQRDWARTAFFRVWGLPLEDLIFDNILSTNLSGTWFPGSNGDRNGEGFIVSREQKRAMEEWVAYVAERGASVVVFEGQVNPDWHSSERQTLHDETAAWLETFSRRGLPLQYVRLDEVFPEEDWKDHTHLNARGREKLTRAMGKILEGVESPK